MRTLYALLILAAAVFCIYCAGGEGRLQTDLNALLPQEQRLNAVEIKADQTAEQQMNGQLFALVGHEDDATAFQTASELAEQWRQSGLFEQVDSEMRPDLAVLRQHGARFGLAFMPFEKRAQLLDRPEQYFRERAEDALNPFAPPSPLPLSDDWLGFGRFLNRADETSGALQWHDGNGMMYAEDGGKTWVLLRGRFADGMMPDADAVRRLYDVSVQTAEHSGGSLLAGGGALFTAAAKARAERESTLMGAAGVLLTFAFLLRLFRSKKVSALLLPPAAGLLAGTAAVLAVFGEIHILTLVIGTSLIGMMVDFPLHWLTPSLFVRRGTVWQARSEMAKMMPVFAVGLLITVSGYLLLWFTPLPVLRQTAVFSAAALLASFGATALWLPRLFADYRGRVSRAQLPADKFLNVGKRLGKNTKRAVCIVLAVLVAAGWWKSSWQDDIRNWVAAEPELLRQVQEIGRIAGVPFGTQAVLLEAGNEDALILASRTVTARLQLLKERGVLDGWEDLGSRLATQEEQRAVQRHLTELAARPAVWRTLREAGVPRETVQTALREAAAWQPAGIADSLAHPLAEAWRPLYLGETDNGKAGALIRLNGLHDAEAVQTAISGIDGVSWSDKRARLNDLFRHTRNQAAGLKLLSFLLAALVLWKLMGRKKAAAVLAVPLAAAVCTVACLGWFGVPVSLFAMFGLLLVAAVGVDYAVFALSRQHGAAARLGGMAAAAATTCISFVLLAFSSTPAVSAFGLTVAIGAAWSLVFARLLLSDKERRYV